MCKMDCESYKKKSFRGLTQNLETSLLEENPIAWLFFLSFQKNNKDPLLINFSVLLGGERLAPKETTVN